MGASLQERTQLFPYCSSTRCAQNYRLRVHSSDRHPKASWQSVSLHATSASAEIHNPYSHAKPPKQLDLSWLLSNLTLCSQKSRCKPKRRSRCDVLHGRWFGERERASYRPKQIQQHWKMRYKASVGLRVWVGSRSSCCRWPKMSGRLAQDYQKVSQLSSSYQFSEGYSDGWRQEFRCTSHQFGGFYHGHVWSCFR